MSYLKNLPAPINLGLLMKSNISIAFNNNSNPSNGTFKLYNNETSFGKQKIFTNKYL
jgi:hypothetical protein